jgi:hypothetical protein
METGQNAGRCGYSSILCGRGPDADDGDRGDESRLFGPGFCRRSPLAATVRTCSE